MPALGGALFSLVLQDGLMTDPTEALLDATGERSIRALALRLGMHQATLNRQVKGTGVPIEVLVAIYREYGADLIDLLANLGHITPEEARRLHRSRGLDEYTDVELTGELHERASRRAISGVRDPSPSER